VEDNKDEEKGKFAEDHSHEDEEFPPDVYKEAEMELGYKVPPERNIQKIFDELGIQTYSEEWVSNYRKKMLRYLLLRHLLPFLYYIPLVCAVSVIVLYFFGYIASGLGALIGLVWLLFAPRVRLRHPSCRQGGLAFYREDIPEYVMQTALQVKKKNPNFQFYIEQFFDGKKIYACLLVAKYGDKDYYLSHWEPDETTLRI